jgi:hypothetical protein
LCSRGRITIIINQIKNILNFIPYTCAIPLPLLLAQS